MANSNRYLHLTPRGHNPAAIAGFVKQALDGTRSYDGDGVFDLDSFAVWEALQRLSPGQRKILLLRYGHGLSEKEISKRLKCSVADVKARLQRACCVSSPVCRGLTELWSTALFSLIQRDNNYFRRI